MINNREAKTDAGCRKPRLAGEKPMIVSPAGAGAFRVWHKIHAEGLVMAMIADSWTCADASWQYMPHGGFLSRFLCFTYCMLPISPCGLMDTYDR